MREAVLRSYFEGSIGATELSRDLVGSMVLGSKPGRIPSVIRHQIVHMETEFEVTIPHLVRLCDDILTGALSPRDLEAIGFCLMASDKFYWTEQPPISEYISDTLHDWTAPEINYQLTQSTVAKFKHRLLTGENPFGPGDYFSDGPHTARPDEPEPKL